MTKQDTDGGGQIWKKDMNKNNRFTLAKFQPKQFYFKKCVNCNKSEFAAKLRIIHLTTIMSKIKLSHMYRTRTM